MANLIDATYFVDDIEVPNVAQAPVAADLLKSITVYEKEVLIDLLGYALYTDLQAAIALPYTTGDKWDKLINGDEFSFTLNGETISVKWEGLLGFQKKSLIAYYVYFLHRRKRASYMSGSKTEVEADAENSVNVQLHDKLTYIWNEFVKLYGDECVEGQRANTSYYHNSVEPSAYNYLLAKRADFPTWVFTGQGGEINRFGI